MLTVRTCPVAVLVSVTVAVTIAAPWLSDTLPNRDAVSRVCDHARLHKTKKIRKRIKIFSRSSLVY